ncbi:MAG: stage II sporulation protein P [Eubacteriales bacterium]|nr:stage II sporulation protein P [Eubacteriales bacterium]
MRRNYRGYRRGIRFGGGKLVLLTVLFWAISGFIMISFINGGPARILEGKQEDVAKMYIGNIFPTVSRSADFESREALGNTLEPAAELTKGLFDAKQSESIFESMIGSMFPGAEVLDDDLAEEDPGIVFDMDSYDSDQDGTPQDMIDTQDSDSPGPATANIDYSKPVVIIYHTHATESYQPVSEGNFHSLAEYGTVREVGDVLTEELEAQGIQVIHDKTIHDSPSYSQSYTRSLETIQTLMGSNESARIIIDLHRDAAAYIGNVAMTSTIKNDTIAKYSLVIGTGNPNVEALRLFANHVNETAEKTYPGFGGKIIEKQYKFNQYVSDYHLLLEVGNNQNTIEQAKLTGKYFARVLAKSIKEIE